MFDFQGIPVDLVHESGDLKFGKDDKGHDWMTRMIAHQGTIRGLDGEGTPVKAWIGPDLASKQFFEIHQINPDGSHDETKLAIGFPDALEAAKTIQAHYPPGVRPVHTMQPIDSLEDWITEKECWHHTAKEHHKRPHLHREPEVYFHGHRLPVEEVLPEEIGEEITKAEPPKGGWPPIPPGAKWITLKNGQHVLLRPVKGHENVFHVTGGAKGKLNFLRVTLTKTPEEYKQEAKEKRKAKAEAEKARKALMTPEEREQEKLNKKAKKAELTEVQKKFAEKALGPYVPQEGEVDRTNDPELHKERFKQALAMAAEARRRIQLDPETREEAGLSEITPGLAIDNVMPAKPDKGVGYTRNIAKLARANNGTGDRAIDAGAAFDANKDKLPSNPTDPNAISSEDATNAAIDVQMETKRLEANKKAAKKEQIAANLEKAENLKDLLLAEQQLHDAERKFRKIKTGHVFPPGYICASSEPTPEDKERLINELTNDILNKQVEGFLNEVEKEYKEIDGIDANHSPEEGMHAARSQAAWGALHEASIAALGEGVMDRNMVETLGTEGAAQVLTRAIKARLKPKEQKELLQALELRHLSEQEGQLLAITSDAQDLRARAKELNVEMINTPQAFADACAMQEAKYDALHEAENLLGGALGRFEAQAALIHALTTTPVKELHVPLGTIAPEQGVKACQAMGLSPESYKMERLGGEALLTIPSETMDKMIRKTDSGKLAKRAVARAIKEGQLDEEGYMPAGFAIRPEQRYENPLTDPPIFQRNIELPEGATEAQLEDSLKTYIGGRWADGHRAADINNDLRGAWMQDQVPEHLKEKLLGVVDRLVATAETVKDANGEPVPARHNGELVKDAEGNVIFEQRPRNVKDIQNDVAKFGKTYLDRQGEADLTLAGQTVDTDHPDFKDAIHRTLASDPRLQAAFAGVGELTSLQQSAIRDWFYKNHAKSEVELGPEPPRFQEEASDLGLGMEMDKEDLVNPAWKDYQEKKRKLSKNWGKYVENMGGLVAAQQAIQDEMKGAFADKFDKHYGQITGRQLQLGTGDIAHYSQHLKAISSPEEAAKLEQERKSKQAKMQLQGSKGFKSVKVKERLQSGAQAALFGSGGALFEPEQPEESWTRPEPTHGERLTLGHRLEGQITQVMPNASAPFQNKGFTPVHIESGVNMSGHFAPQQRGIKAIKNMKRIGLFYGAGSGKTSIMYGANSELFHEGKIKKSIIAAKSNNVGGFGAEAIKFFDPDSKFKVHANPGESYEQRLQSYRDPEKHCVVVSHQNFRDDSVKILAQHLKKTPDQAAEWAMNAKPEELKKSLKAAFNAQGIDFQSFMLDEGHDALNRKGKPNSLLANIMDAHGYNAEYYAGATGSPYKNDISEIFDWCHKIDPENYPLDSQDEFLRRFGGNSAIGRRALEAEFDPHFFIERINPTTNADDKKHLVELDPEQKDRVDQIDWACGKIQIGEDVEKWAKQLVPEKFKDQPEEKHAEIAEGIRRGIGIFQKNEMNKVINTGGAKVTEAVRLAKEHLAKGEPAVLFAHNLEMVHKLHQSLQDAGLKSLMVEGTDSASEKTRKTADFDNGEADVIVLSDAAQTGVNLQHHGRVMIHADYPDTYTKMEQRTARIYRIGQKHDVTVYHLHANHPWEDKNAKLVAKKEMDSRIYRSKEGVLDDTGQAELLRGLETQDGEAA